MSSWWDVQPLPRTIDNGQEFGGGVIASSTDPPPYIGGAGDPNAGRLGQMAGGATGGSAADLDAYFNSLFPGDYLDSAMLLAKEQELAQRGIKVLRNAEGRAGKIQYPNGEIIDVVQGGGTGLNRKQMLRSDPAGGGGLAGAGGTLIDPWTQDFKARDPNEIANDPAYQFQLQQGLQGVERGAASKGTLLTGGTMKALAGYGQGLASTYNDKYYGRDMNEYLMKYGIFKDNQDRPYDKLSRLAALGKPTGGG